MPDKPKDGSRREKPKVSLPTKRPIRIWSHPSQRGKPQQSAAFGFTSLSTVETSVYPGKPRAGHSMAFQLCVRRFDVFGSNDRPPGGNQRGCRLDTRSFQRHAQIAEERTIKRRLQHGYTAI